MKKVLLTMIFTITLIMSTQSIFATDDSGSIEYYNDGSYSITTISDDIPAISDNLFTLAITLSKTTKTKSKTTTFYNSSNKAMWYVKVTGTFSYGNGSATCTDATVSAASYNDAWRISNKSSSKSGNRAIGTATAKRYQNLSVAETKTKTVTLTCSSTGVFS